MKNLIRIKVNKWAITRVRKLYCYMKFYYKNLPQTDVNEYHINNCKKCIDILSMYFERAADQEFKIEV